MCLGFYWEPILLPNLLPRETQKYKRTKGKALNATNLFSACTTTTLHRRPFILGVSLSLGPLKPYTKARFTLGVRADVQLKSSIPIGAKVEISPKGFTLGVKAEIEKLIFSICLLYIDVQCKVPPLISRGPCKLHVKGLIRV